MSLKDIRDRVIIETQHNPNDASYYVMLNNLINDTHKAIYYSRPWPFTTETKQMDIYPDKTSERCQNATISCNVNENIVTFSTTDADFEPYIVGPEDVGQYIEIEGYDYLIDAFQNNKLYLAEPLRRSTNEDLEDYADWKIKHKTYFMPKDCIDILDISFRDANVVNAQNAGKMFSIPARLDTDRNLSLQDTANKPSWYIPQDPYYVKAPEIAISGVNQFLTFTVTPYEIDDPDQIPLPAGSYYFGFSFVYGGQDTTNLLPESSICWLTQPVSFNGSDEIAEVTLQDLFFNSAMGLCVKYYIGQDNGLGQIIPRELFKASTNPYTPLYAQFNSFWYSIPTIYVDARNLVNPVLLTSNQIQKPGPYKSLRPFTSGYSKSVKFYPRPDSIDQDVKGITDDVADGYGVVYNRPVWRTQFTLRYLKACPDLLLSTDDISLPKEFEQVIINKVISELYIRYINNPNMSIVFEKKYKDSLKILESRYASFEDSLIVKRGSWNRIISGETILYPNPVVYRH